MTLAMLLLMGSQIAWAQVAAPTDGVLPAGVKAVWDLDKSQRERTPTRDRACLNGLWRWQPAQADADAVPKGNWGFFKAPGFWPGTANYIQEDCQTLYRHPNWKTADVRQLSAAWYQREFSVPASWNDRRITVAAEYVNSLAFVFVDGKKAGAIHFPAGEVDLTHLCKPDSKHTLSLLVVALPLKGVLLSYNDTNAAREVKGTVERRGLCGDVWLTSTPAGPRITDVKVDTSVRQWTITISSAIDGTTPDAKYSLEVEIQEQGKTIQRLKAREFKATALKSGRHSFTAEWKPAKLWDIHTPQNMLSLHVALIDDFGKRLDQADPVRFGFREFWIDGKDFYLNGTRIFLSAVPLDNGQIGPRTASYQGAMETMKRLRSFGINFVYTHNYGCQPGSHISFREILRAADDAGMLVGLSQPHFGHYDWKAQDADQSYGRHAAFYVRAAGSHPSVVAYAMSHNATGYDEDMNPDLIDGRRDPRRDSWSLNNAKLALRAEGIVKSLDPQRNVYHHSSGNLGSMHTSNFYINFTPIQEVSDWFEHWSKNGVKPMFPVEYGVPFSWDWTMYRGWYKGERNWGSAKVPWEFCLAEWNAQFQGDRAYQISEREKQNLRWEAGQFKAGNVWQRWDYPHAVGARDFDERGEIFARYITDNWRAFRTWGLSANSPWEHHIYWKLKEGVDKSRRDFKADWDNLQRPGFSADYTQRPNGQFSTDFDADDWEPTAAAKALVRNNMPLLAYIGGKSGAFTSKDHNFRPGETIEKQLVVINNARETVSFDYAWNVLSANKGLPLNLPKDSGRNVSVKTGDQVRLPIRFKLDALLPADTYGLSATVRFSTGETQSDVTAIHVLPAPLEVALRSKIALFDPKGETAKLLEGIKVAFQRVDAKADLKDYDVLIIGKGALTPDGPGPDVMRVRDGLKVIVFEQSAKALEQRFGFRIAEYGLREVFPRVSDHPLLPGLRTEHLHDWRGEATLSSARLDYTLRPRYGPTVKWCGIEVPRAWRCGCRGNVASVLIERPARGDFLSIIDGGYALQYSPLLEHREGKGLVLFCQLDVTGRTESDPAADVLTRNILRYIATWKARPERLARRVIYAGEPAGKKHLQAAGFAPLDYAKAELAPDRVLVVGPGGGKSLAADGADIAVWQRSGGRVLAIGLDEADARAFLPMNLKIKKVEHIASFFAAPGVKSALAGVGPADVHNRDPRVLPLIADGLSILGNGVLAESQDGSVVFCQLVPWHFDPAKAMNMKRTFRRSSCAVARLAANLGAASETPVLSRFHTPAAADEQRWLSGLYLDVPGEWDDPYRYFRW
jgi:beta-galactosidase/beta-glucuronidase